MEMKTSIIKGVSTYFIQIQDRKGNSHEKIQNNTAVSAILKLVFGSLGIEKKKRTSM